MLACKFKILIEHLEICDYYKCIAIIKSIKYGINFIFIRKNTKNIISEFDISNSIDIIEIKINSALTEDCKQNKSKI